MNDIRKKANDYAKFKHQEEYNDTSYHRDVLETIKDFEAGYKKALAISRVGSAFYCQRDIEGDSICNSQCEHCNEYYKPLEQ